MMSRKDYTAVAAILARERASDHDVSTKDAVLNRVEEDLASYFARDNPQFDADRFFAAAKGGRS